MPIYSVQRTCLSVASSSWPHTYEYQDRVRDGYAELRVDMDLFTEKIAARRESIIPSPEHVELGRISPISLWVRTSDDAWRAITLTHQVNRHPSNSCVPCRISCLYSLPTLLGARPPSCSKTLPNKASLLRAHWSERTKRIQACSGAFCV